MSSHMFVCATHACRLPSEAREDVNPLDLELQIPRSCLMCIGNSDSG